MEVRGASETSQQKRFKGKVKSPLWIFSWNAEKIHKSEDKSAGIYIV